MAPAADDVLETVRGLTVGEPVLGWVDVGGGYAFRVKRMAQWNVDVTLMMFNWRVQLKLVGDEFCYDRYWCYAGRGDRAFTTAVLACARWDVRDDTEPEGWNKNGQTGEWREP
jgi:hypothetical protein